MTIDTHAICAARLRSTSAQPSTRPLEPPTTARKRGTGTGLTTTPQTSVPVRQRSGSVSKCRLGDLGSLERRHNLGAEPFQLLQTYGSRHTDRQAHRHAVETGIAPFEALQVLDHLLRRAAQEAAVGDRVLDPGQFRRLSACAIAHDLDLLVGQGTHETQLAEHLHVFFVKFGSLADPLLAVLGKIEMESEAQPLAHFEVDAAPLMRLLPAQHDAVHRAALGRPAADEAPDSVLCHKVHGSRGAALNGLPAFYRTPQGAGHDGQLLQHVAAI